MSHNAKRATPAGLELLWGERQRPRRGPKPGLSVEQIVRAAIEVADADGQTALSMGRVAEQLGTGVASLYRYVPGKAELVGLAVDAVLEHPPRSIREDADWRSRLAEWARALLDVIRRHPWILPLLTSRKGVPGPNETQWLEDALAAISDIGLSDVECIEVISLLNWYVRGAAQVAIDIRLGTPEEDASESPISGPMLRLVTGERFPTVNRVLASGAFDQPADVIEFGLNRVLDGVETFLAAKGVRTEKD
ncbi:TetR/AcrR family transcriptional regulator [Actinoalloteichus hymeniacidonis]|uniref:Transcriptional regulator, TetR family n=1 Tax=Actinoalloteichus hymeniacidonis TaxID=340345 RepID=A0AAC9MYQ4_9PSEU|nr:TetR/AcrR family transcriptional regulator C-terminal domain-containing protein [Actinoalloteichus hymeniacidonis]AOS63540.1 transcriptional regulator, TetR family [Actinoalloteichus hymeniacidonis]MBB5908415.1 AcrR family transcriptional regulator [Actinoalloteichus hymeniacidonis]